MHLCSGKQPFPFLPTRNLLHVAWDQPMCCHLLSDHWFLARGFHPRKGTPNLIYYEEMPDVARESLLFHIRENQHRVISYNQGKWCISQTPQSRVWEVLIPLYHQKLQCTWSPLWIRSGNQPHFFHCYTSPIIMAQKKKWSLFAL